MMEGIYKSTHNLLPGTEWSEIIKPLEQTYRKIKRGGRRRPYIRSKYFDKQKIFTGIFWAHLFEKENFRDKIRRIKLFPAAIDLLQNSRIKPTSQINSKRQNEMLHRFYGITRDGIKFCVQVKESVSTHEKNLLSIFPID